MRLWNYAEGTPEDALISLDFGALFAGWEADQPVWAGAVDRIFVSLVAPGYDGTEAALDAPAEGWAELSGIVCEGSGSVLGLGDGQLPAHGLRIATGYDDLYHLTPARVLRNALRLGYRGLLNHYVGMSHYFRLDGGLVADGLNGPCAAWHADFLERAKALGFEAVLSLSYEVLAQHCPAAWQQRAENGDPALTGWEPPSTLLSPANAAAMAWLQGIARAFAALAVAAGMPVRFQVGEPWWWVMPEGRICLYDDAAAAGFDPVSDCRTCAAASMQRSLRRSMPPERCSRPRPPPCARRCEDEAPAAECLLLVYLPTVLDGAEVRRANVPSGWAAPAFDRLQLEDYDWAASGRRGASARGAAAMAARLGYPVAEQHYFAGFVPAADEAALWAPVAAAAEAARERGTADVFVWALPQVLRDGFVFFEGEEAMDAFADVPFPIALGREASVEPAFSTAIVTMAGGAEQRNADWADARLRFDAGPGVRSEAELHELLAFFRARRGGGGGFPVPGPVRPQFERDDRIAGGGGPGDRDR